MHLTRAKDDNGNWNVYDDVNVGDRDAYAAGTSGIDCTGLIQQPLCTLLDTVDTAGQ